MTDKISDYLGGPWLAVLSDQSGFVYESVADAHENGDDPGEEFSVSIRRGSALPNNRSGDRLRLPGSFLSGDQIFDLDDLYLDDNGDMSVSAEARYEQAKAMADGLNRASAGADRKDEE